MPRSRRYSPPDSLHHIINRGNDRRCLFDSPEEFEGFLDLMSWAKGQCPLRILAYALIENHFHFVVWPETEHAIELFMHRLSTTHAVRRRRVTGTVGHGHIYQGRYRGFIIDSESYYYRALRYVEANPLRAKLVRTAKDWPWSSLTERLGRDRGILDEGPLALPDNWAELVDEPLPQEFLDDIRKKLRIHGKRRTLKGL
jgi:putative transposase